jgi:hypothetical protein
MIPLLAVVHVRNKRGPGLHLWVPLFLLWLLLAPAILLLSPLILVACLVGRVDPLRALSVVWQVCAGLTNTYIEVSHPGVSVLIRVV